MSRKPVSRKPVSRKRNFFTGYLTESIPVGIIVSVIMIYSPNARHWLTRNPWLALGLALVFITILDQFIPWNLGGRRGKPKPGGGN